MPPRRSRRTNNSNENESEIPKNVSNEYIEIDMADLNIPPAADSIQEASDEVSIELSDSEEAVYTLSRKARLQIRKCHLMAEMCALRLVATQLWSKKGEEMTALALSLVPPHILRIFDPIALASPEGQKSIKNCVGMLATWWKNHFGFRMSRNDAGLKIPYSSHKFAQLKAALSSKNAYEDDFVKLFSLVLNALGVNVRFVHSLELLSASTAVKSAKTEDSKSFQYTPHYWLEVYAPFEKRWFCLNCIDGSVDEKGKLENKSFVHSFVLAVDRDGRIHDLTTKYASDYTGKSFKLRKDEDKWLAACISYFNTRIRTKHACLPDVEASAPFTNNEVIEIPKTLAAIKNHPTLMLGSQLKKYEVFYPVCEPVGFFKDEPVFLKANVQRVRSRDAWLSQHARVVKDSEEPIKLVNLPRKAGAPESEPTGVQPLFGEWQTVAYQPPEVIDGKVPRNEHGNVDLFQPQMLPKGCVHVTLPGAWKVARALGIDYSDACIGFSFHGGRAVPSIHGIVITEANYQPFDSKYKETLIQSLQKDADALELQMAQKWVKIIKNALIARRLKHDSSISLSDSIMSAIKESIEADAERPAEECISTFSKSKSSAADDVSEIDEFDAI